MPLLLLIALLVLLNAPQIWVRLVLRRHARPRDDLPGTGGELARHLVERLQLGPIAVEQTEPGHDHFDPTAPAVRLSRPPRVTEGSSRVTTSTYFGSS